MDWPAIIREIGGGAMGVMVAGLCGAVLMLWRRVTELQNRLFDAQQTASRELREMQAASHTALAANSAALASMAAAIQAQGRAG